MRRRYKDQCDVISTQNTCRGFVTYTGDKELSDVIIGVVCDGVGDDSEGVCLTGVPGAFCPVHFALVLFICAFKKS